MFFKNRQNLAYDKAYGQAEGMIKQVACDFVDKITTGKVEMHTGNAKQINKDLQKFMQERIYDIGDVMQIRFKLRDIRALIDTGMREVRLISYSITN